MFAWFFGNPLLQLATWFVYGPLRSGRIHQKRDNGGFILNGIIRQKIVALLHHISLDAKESLPGKISLVEIQLNS